MVHIQLLLQIRVHQGIGITLFHHKLLLLILLPCIMQIFDLCTTSFHKWDTKMTKYLLHSRSRTSRGPCACHLNTCDSYNGIKSTLIYHRVS